MFLAILVDCCDEFCGVELSCTEVETVVQVISKGGSHGKESVHTN